MPNETPADFLDWAKMVLRSTPDTRAALVRSLQVQIQAGLYTVPIEELAQLIAHQICRSLPMESD